MLEQTGIVEQRAADRAKWGRYAYRAPVVAEKTHRITVDCRTGERSVETTAHRPRAETVNPFDAPTEPPVAQSPEPIKVEKPVRIFCDMRRRHATNKHMPFQPDHRGRVSDVIVTAAAVFDISVAEILSPSRTRRTAYPRFAAMHILTKVLRISLVSIGRTLNRDHTTVLSGVRKAAQLRRDDIAFAGRSRLLAAALRRKWSVQ